MKTVFIVKEMSSQPYEDNIWISGVFDSEEKAIVYLREMQVEDCNGDYIYLLSEWEVK